MDQEEYFFQCPYCWQKISVVVDLSTPSQHYVEDCEVCCQPIDIHIEVDDHSITSFEANPL